MVQVEKEGREAVVGSGLSEVRDKIPWDKFFFKCVF